MASGELVTVEVKGLDELQTALEAMADKVAKKGIRSALKAGAKPIADGMVALAPKDTGFMAENFNVRVSMRRDELAGSAYIGPKGKVDYPAYASGAYNIRRTATGRAKKIGRIAVATVARFLEFGTSKLGKHPFMTQAYESYKESALARIIQTLREYVA